MIYLFNVYQSIDRETPKSKNNLAGLGGGG